jgi:glycosyltransferase involved in cell wall biosynthesis
VRYLGPVSDEDLAALYTGAEVLVFPSLYEGFGLPILDAFACGCPVVTSNLSSMPEVAGDAAVLVDPYDVNSIADGIEKALRWRKGLIEKGSKWVKQFSWIKTAAETLKTYKEASGLC